MKNITSPAAEYKKGGSHMAEIIEQITDALNRIYQDELESFRKEQHMKERINR